MSFSEIFVHFEQFRHNLALCHIEVETESIHHGVVVGLVGLAQVGGHESLVMQVGQGAVAILFQQGVIDSANDFAGIRISLVICSLLASTMLSTRSL